MSSLPSRFPVVPLKWLIDPLRPITYGIVQAGEDIPDGVPYIRPVDMHDECGIKAHELRRTSLEIASSYQRSKVLPGDLVISIGPSYGKVLIVPQELAGANLTQGTARVACLAASVVPRFMFWLLRSSFAQAQWRAAVNSATFAGLNLEPLANTLLPVPALRIQKAISAALDKETARIDALIHKKTRLIELLREKRQALITQAVTRGLDPSVPMSDSGLQWVGKIPAHWQVLPVKRLATLDGGAGFPESEQGSTDGPIPFFKVADLANGLAMAESTVTEDVAKSLGAKVFPAGTLAFAKVGAALLLNRRCLMPVAGCLDNNMMAVIPGNCHPRWLFWFLSVFDMGRLCNPGAVPSINQEQVASIQVPTPPLSEQMHIAEYLDRAVHLAGAIQATVDRSITLLRERRAALITAAVTGQIDLRAQVTEEAAEPA